MRLAVLPLAAFALLPACSAPADDPAAVSADEARQLNEAAEMLDVNSIDLNAVDAAATNESQPR